MTLANPEVNYIDERRKLRSSYVKAHPRQRLRTIRDRLAQQEIGPTRLVTVVSAVEALARSLVVRAKAKSTSDIEQTYSSYRHLLFREAVKFRKQVVHECTCLGQDKYPSLIKASEEVLEALITVGGLGDEPNHSVILQRL